MFNKVIDALTASKISTKNTWKINIEKDIVLASVISSIKRAANEGQFNTSIKLSDGVLKYSSYIYSELLSLSYRVRISRHYIYISW